MTVRFQISDSTDPSGDIASQFRDMLMGLLSVPIADSPAEKRPELRASGKRGFTWNYGDREFDIVVSGPYKKRAQPKQD